MSKEQEDLLWAVYSQLQHINGELAKVSEQILRIERRLESRYGVRIRQDFPSTAMQTTDGLGNVRFYDQYKEIQMALTQGGTGTFAAQLLDNGNPITAPNPFTWAVDDPNATVTPSADTLSAVVNVPAGDSSSQVTITASTIAPDGSTASGTLVVPITAAAQKFTVSISQTA